MFGLDQPQQVSLYVEDSLLAWVRLYSGFQTIQDVTQLSDGRFFLNVLQTLPNFRLSSPMKQLGQQQSLTVKLNNIKNIAHSLIKYHQTLLLRDVSDLKISYIQLCMGNKKQLYRLIYILFSALCSQPSSRQLLESKISKLSEQKSQILKIMIEKSAKIGVQCSSPTDRSWSLNQQRKILDRMQTLQNKIQQLQIQNKALEQTIRTQKQTQQYLNQQNKKQKQQLKKLLQLNNQLSETNEKASNELKLSFIEQNTAKKKLEIVKTKYEEKITKLQMEIQASSAAALQCRMLKQKICNITQINRQIKQQNYNLRQVIKQLQNQRLQNRKLHKIHKEQYINLKQYCSDLQIQIQQLTINLSEKISDNSQNCYYNNKIVEVGDGSDSNRYRVKENLQWLNNTEEYNISTQYKHQIKQNNNTNPQPKSLKLAKPNDADFEIRTITERSFEDSDVCLQNMKENHSIIMNCSQLARSAQHMQDKTFKENKYRSQGHTSHNHHHSQHNQQQYESEIKFLVCIVLDLQDQLQYAKNTNPIISDRSTVLSASRMHKFRTKVKQMFNKQQTIYTPLR